jgi:hypothetical protein
MLLVFQNCENTIFFTCAKLIIMSSICQRVFKSAVSLAKTMINQGITRQKKILIRVFSY